jgi:hypothetical protein
LPPENRRLHKWLIFGLVQDISVFFSPCLAMVLAACPRRLVVESGWCRV